MSPNRSMTVVLGVLAVIAGTVIVVERPPAPLPATSPDRQFSAERAQATLQDILADGAPHPVGTPAHDAVRDRIVTRFCTLGYTTSIQQTLGCNARVTCAPVMNIMARLAGDARADTLAVVAHYDSVAAGAGASDDGIGVASVLEIARAVRQQRFRNSILFLITDGEELGLLGAEAFVADPTVSSGVAAAINVDNRGTSGRSLLFETSEQNRWLVETAARALPRPAASSLYYAMYKLLPNDTDFSVFKRSGIAGINFACVGEVADYHTPLDDLRHVTPSTIQDHGDHMLAMTRALANADLHQTSDGDAVFFDVLSLGVLWWPEAWTRWMAFGALLVLLMAAAIRLGHHQTTPAGIISGVLSFFLTVTASALLGGLAAWIASLRASSAVWAAQPDPSIAAMWLIGAAAAIVSTRPFYARAGFDGLFVGHGLAWAAIALAATILLPGSSYLAAVPAILFALCAALRATTDIPEVWAAGIVSAGTAILWFPNVLRLYDFMGRPTLPVTAAIVAMISTAFTPLTASIGQVRHSVVAAMAAAAAFCVAMQLLIPAYTPESPRRLNIRYVDDDGSPRWQVDAATPELKRQAPFTEMSRAVTPWVSAPQRSYSTPAPRLPLSPPELRIVSDEHQNGRRLLLVLRSTRGANALALILHAPDVARLRVDGVAPPQRPAKFASRLAPGWQAINIIGAQSAFIAVTLRKDEPIDAIVVDRSGALPPQAAALMRARVQSNAVPSSDGDAIIVQRHVHL